MRICHICILKWQLSTPVLNLITPNCFMAKVDIKDAYYSVPIMEEHQKYLKFWFKGELYQFTCLPNGLCSGPRKFTKLLKPRLADMRKNKITVSSYIDDLITIAKSYATCYDSVLHCVQLLDSLGFVVHPEKSEFFPSQKLEYLGFIIDSIKMTISYRAFFTSEWPGGGKHTPPLIFQQLLIVRPLNLAQ